MKKLLAILLAVLFSQLSSAKAGDHPSSGHAPNEVFGYPSQAPAAWSRGDLTFEGPQNMAELSELSSVEKYMLAGTKSSASSPSQGLEPWERTLWTYVAKFYAEKGYVPAQLTLHELRSCDSFEGLSDSDLAVVRSPITNDWPVLNAKTFSAGNAYIRPLTNEEVRHFAKYSRIWTKVWLEGLNKDRTKNRDSSLKSAEAVNALYTKPYELSGPVWYVKIYGHKGVIQNTFTYAGTYK